MSKKMKKLPSIFEIVEEAKKPWQGPAAASCSHYKTLSFRAQNEVVLATPNAASVDVETTDPSITNPSLKSSETVISGSRLSDRLFFEPEETSSIMASKNGHGRNCPFKNSVALALESDDPYLDFKKSMQEMLESHGFSTDNWDCLEDLLEQYLRMNGKMNHGFIVGAFADLIVGFSAEKTTTSCSDSTADYLSASSSLPSAHAGASANEQES